MTSKERYDKIFLESLGLQPQDLNASLAYNSVSAWDSVGHMSLIAALETEFDIMLETEDVIDFSSYDKGMKTLAGYKVEF